MDRVKGKVAIVTGAALGLGQAQVRMLAREGARVVVTDVKETEGKAVAEEIQSEGGKALFVRHDVSSEESWKSLVDMTISEFGKLDVLVNNAGVFILPQKHIEDNDLEEWRWLMSINLDGVFLGTKYAIGAMKKSGGGSIINLSSVAGLVAMPQSSAYTASKGAVRLFTKATALECSKADLGYNIRCNSIHPHLIWTDLFNNLVTKMVETTGQTAEQIKSDIAADSMLGTFGDPDDVAYAVIYLASDESKFITGTEIVIDGGYTAR